MVIYIRSCSGLDKFCEGTIYRCDENKFFSSKRTPQRLPFVCKEREERREGRRGRKVYHFNLTFLRMRVNNTYPMESYFSKPHRLCTLHAECFTVRERDRQRESPPGPPTIYPSILPVQQKKGGARERSFSCYHPRTDHSSNVAFTRLSTSFPLPNELFRLRTHRMILHRHRHPLRDR